MTCWKPPEGIRQNNNLTGGYMTKKDFKAAMLRGLGRCVVAVTQEPEKYRDIVLWACARNISYDTQSEGSRAWYIYTLANAYPDKETFIQAAEDALKKYRPTGGWDLLFLSEFLMLFALDGYDSARQALEDKYQELLAAVFKQKRKSYQVFHALSDLEQMGLVLAVDRTSFLRIAGDFGNLYRKKSDMQGGDFAWFFSSKGEQYKKAMERAAQKNENIACFMEREQADIAAQQANWEQRKAIAPEDFTGVRRARWVAKNADKETLGQYALAYRNQTQPQLRADALDTFQWCPYPDDPQPIIEDTQSACEELRNAAWHALEILRHPAVRLFALANTASGIHTPENFALLVTNYLPKDAQLLEDLLWELIAANDWDGVHAAGMDVYRAFYKNSGIPHPKHLLPLLYEYNPCSFCRESAVSYMSRHRMLTEEILAECLHDSNYDIRQFAVKRLQKMRKQLCTG